MIAKEAGLRGVVAEMIGLTEKALKRPGDVTVLGYSGYARHLVIDVVIKHEFCSSNIVSASRGPDDLLRAAEKSKMGQSRLAVERRGHRFIPFAVSSLGRMGGHAVALLDEWADYAAKTRGARQHDWRRSVPEVRRQLLTKWLQMVSVCVHASVAGTVCHGLAPLD
jgi:hypothetical protein